MVEPANLNEEPAEASPKVKAIQLKISVITAISMVFVAVLGFAEIFISPDSTIPKYLVKIIAGIVIPAIVPLVKAVYGKQLKAAQMEWDALHGIEISVIDIRKPAILSRAEYLARSMGTQMGELIIDETSKDLIRVIGIPVNRIWMSGRAVEELSEAEMDFALAHAIATLKAGHLKQSNLVLIPSIILATCLSLWFLAKNLANEYITFTTVLYFLLFVFLVLIIIILINYIRGKSRADYLALKETRNLEAAQSVVIKMDKNYQQEEIEGEDLNFDEDLSRRLASFNRIAEQLGLLTPSTQRSAFESGG
ncbi:MAG: hypothetical protein ACYC0V_08450 [Armatimonadota bacterium]